MKERFIWGLVGIGGMIAVLFNLAVFVALVLGIVWLWKQVM
jgi:hypothetical protein